MATSRRIKSGGVGEHVLSVVVTEFEASQATDWLMDHRADLPIPLKEVLHALNSIGQGNGRGASD